MADGEGVVAVDGKGDSLGLPLGPDSPHGFGQGLAEGALLQVEGKGPRLQTGHFDEGGQEELQLVHLPGHEGEELFPLFRGKGVLPEDAQEHLQVGQGGLYLVGDVTHQFLDGLLVLCALALAIGHLLIVLEKLSLDLGGDGVLIGLYGGKAFPLHEGVHGIAEVVGQVPRLPPPQDFPPNHQGHHPQTESQQPAPKQGKGQGLPHQGPQADEAPQGHHGGPQPPGHGLGPHAAAPVQM